MMQLLFQLEFKRIFRWCKKNILLFSIGGLRHSFETNGTLTRNPLLVKLVDSISLHSTFFNRIGY